MRVFALWSAPRARSTAFFRSMLERGDLVALHEPFCNLICYGETDAGGRTFDSAASLLAWLRETGDPGVFLKDTTDCRHPEVLADQRLLAEGRHAFLIRRPEEIAASYYSPYPRMSINAIGLQPLPELHAAVQTPAGTAPSSSTRTASWHGPQRRWRLTAQPSGCRSSRGRSGGNLGDGLSGGDPHAGTRPCYEQLHSERLEAAASAGE
jgi:hypothetical protein